MIDVTTGKPSARLHTVRTMSDNDIIIVISPATADALDGLYRFLHGASSPNAATLFEYGRQLGAVVKSIEAELIGATKDIHIVEVGE